MKNSHTLRNLLQQAFDALEAATDSDIDAARKIMEAIQLLGPTTRVIPAAPSPGSAMLQRIAAVYRCATRLEASGLVVRNTYGICGFPSKPAIEIAAPPSEILDGLPIGGGWKRAEVAGCAVLWLGE